MVTLDSYLTYLLFIFHFHPVHVNLHFTPPYIGIKVAQFSYLPSFREFPRLYGKKMLCGILRCFSDCSDLSGGAQPVSNNTAAEPLSGKNSFPNQQLWIAWVYDLQSSTWPLGASVRRSSAGATHLPSGCYLWNRPSEPPRAALLTTHGVHAPREPFVSADPGTRSFNEICEECLLNWRQNDAVLPRHHFPHEVTPYSSVFVIVD